MWHVYFDGCNTTEETTGFNELEAPQDDTWEAIDRMSLEDLERANDFKTPRKVRMMPGFWDHEDAFKMVKPEQMDALDLTGLFPLEGAPSPNQKAVLQMVEGWERIKSNFEVLWNTVKAYEDKGRNDESGMRSQIQEAMNYINDVGAKARLLSAKIGRNPRTDSDGESTLWEVMPELGYEIKSVRRATDPLPQAIKEAHANHLKQVIDLRCTTENMTKMYSHGKGYLGTNNSRMAEVEHKLSASNQHSAGQTQEGVFEFDQPTVTPSLKDDVQKLRDEVSVLRSAQATTTAQDERSSSNPLFPAAGQNEILARLKVVETRGVSGVTCDLSSTTFASEADVKAYIKLHDIPSCALYWDLFSIMVCMGAEGLTGKERSDRIYSAEKGRTGSALEGELVASMSHKRPLCLYGEGTRLARLDAGFAMCKTYEQWIGGGNQVSYRAELSSQLLVYSDGIMGQIGPPSTPAHYLAQVLLTQVGMQWNAVVGFVDMFYLELVAKCKFDPTKAWKLVAVCVAAIFEAAQPSRAKVILLEDSTKIDQKAAFMWAIFQTHRVIQSFIGVQFKSHPAIVKEISLFMVTERVDPKEILELGTKCKKAEAEAGKAVAEVKKLSDSHNELKRKHDALLADFKIVKAKVK
jgi:hypothetical protein